MTYRAGALAAGAGLLGLAADAATKAWALSVLRDGHRITVPGDLLRLQLVTNHGAAFGLGAAYEPLVAVISAALVALLVIWAWRATGLLEKTSAALAAAGGIGNLADRMFRPPSFLHGAVVDWIHVSFYGPTFNLADVFLRIGVVLAAAAWLWHHRPQPHLQPQLRAHPNNNDGPSSLS
ncbi:MAG: signal peptidase II [Streptosporangiaceae bacterium]